MNTFIKEIKESVYELEGLLLVVENHGGDTQDVVYQMIHDKAAKIAELSKKVVPETCSSTENVETEIVTPPPFAEIEEEIDDNMTQHDSEEEIGEILSIDYEEPSKVNEKEPEHNAEEPVAEEDEAEDDEELPDYEEIMDDGPEYEDPTITVDAALQRDMSKNLRKAFSLNDRFRYRRELFSNSDVEMTNALNLVEAMDTYSEAEEYFYGDMEWDKDSPEVMDFMSIIKNHFYSK